MISWLAFEWKKKLPLTTAADRVVFILDNMKFCVNALYFSSWGAHGNSNNSTSKDFWGNACFKCLSWISMLLSRVHKFIFANRFQQNKLKMHSDDSTVWSFWRLQFVLLLNCFVLYWETFLMFCQPHLYERNQPGFWLRTVYRH